MRRHTQPGHVLRWNMPTHHSPNAGIGAWVHHEAQAAVTELLVQLQPRDPSFHLRIQVLSVDLQHLIHPGEVQAHPSEVGANVALVADVESKDCGCSDYGIYFVLSRFVEFVACFSIRII
jgi:hypothetical protein